MHDFATFMVVWCFLRDGLGSKLKYTEASSDSPQ